MPKAKRQGKATVLNQDKIKIKKLREKLVELRFALAKQKKLFKQRLHQIRSDAYQKAGNTLLQVLEKREDARLKALTLAEIHFEKKYARKLTKKLAFLMPSDASENAHKKIISANRKKLQRVVKKSYSRQMKASVVRQ